MNSRTKIINPDVFDKLEIEVGDTKQPIFYPQVKIKRWDNEVNASFRLIDDEPKQLVIKGEKIKLVGNKKEVHFYELPVSKELQEGGYEFEVILKEKPASNKLEFSIETKGLSFFYQRELTQEEKDKGTIRPDNIVGSYAVYCSENKINYVGGKLYRTGKVGHIYRPKIIDSAGNWVWGELNIDVKKKLLTVTIPQEFLDTAVYPVRHAAGLLFGYDTIGSSGVDISSYLSGSLYTGEIGTAISMTLAVDEVFGGTIYSNTRCAIYRQSTLALLSNGVTDEELILYEDEPGWRTLTFSEGPTLQNVDYLLMAWCAVYEGRLPSLKMDEGETNQLYRQYITYNGFPDPLVPSYLDYKVSIYCTYQSRAVKTFTSDGIIVERKTEGITIDGLVKATQAKTFTIDGVIRQTVTKTFTLDCVIKQIVIKVFTIDGIVKEINTSTFTVDGIIREEKTATFTINGIVEILGTKTFTIDGIVLVVQTIPFTIDGIVQETKTITFTIDGIILETKTSAFTIDGIVLVPNEKTFTIDAHVVGTGTITFTIDSLIVQRTTKTFTIDGLVGPLYYFLDDDLIPRPNSLTREVIWQKQDMTTIDGKTSRDTGMRKEIYMLTWEILDRENADLIMGIVERNTSVNFKVNDGKLQINEVSVIPSVPLRIYRALGSDYLEGFILILTVEQGT